MKRIRKEIKADNTFGGNYPFDIDYPNLPNNYIEITEDQKNCIDANLNILFYDKTKGGIFESPKGVVDISTTPAYISEQALKRQATFEKSFFEIPNVGWYRKAPKGYSSAIESINTAAILVPSMNGLPADLLTYYTAPDFTDEAQCTETWLIGNSYKNTDMTITEFATLFGVFVAAWNSTEHE